MGVLIDGLHTGDAVKFELDHLTSKGIIRNEDDMQDFAVVWDDCDEGGIKSVVFDDSFPKLHQMFAGRSVCSGRFFIPGWIGNKEAPHGTCVFTTLDLLG